MTGSYAYNLGSAFRAVAREHSSRTALAYPEGREVRYGELDALSNRIARLLADRGIRRRDVVAIFSDKSVEAYASMLACLKLGATYTNLDVTSPWSRVRKMVEACIPALVLHDRMEPEVFEGVSAEKGIPTLELGAAATKDLVAARNDGDLDPRATTGQDPAYVMFTSGSTGFPKGAVMSHSNVLNFIGWSRETLRVTADDVLTNVNPMYFDNSVFDFYTALFNGATLCPLKADPSGGGMRNLVKDINRLGCTIWFSVPSLLVYLLITKAIGEDDFPNVTRFVFGGEGFPKPKLAQLHGLYGRRARLVNVYGPTECTCICSSYDITERDLENQADLAPLGRIAPNFDYVIDPADPANPDFGELLLAGPNVGLGYYGDAERTRRSFVQDPTESRYARIVYRTGDLILRDENDHLHFRGRVDNQIKHMGYRIELEEIEAGLNSLPYVEEAAVVYVRQNAGIGKIVAFVNAPPAKEPGEVTEDIRRIVPPYMVPKDVHVTGALPKNRNGKIDRVRLREQTREQVKS